MKHLNNLIASDHFLICQLRLFIKYNLYNFLHLKIDVDSILFFGSGSVYMIDPLTDHSYSLEILIILTST